MLAPIKEETGPAAAANAAAATLAPVPMPGVGTLPPHMSALNVSAASVGGVVSAQQTTLTHMQLQQPLAAAGAAAAAGAPPPKREGAMPAAAAAAAATPAFPPTTLPTPGAPASAMPPLNANMPTLVAHSSSGTSTLPVHPPSRSPSMPNLTTQPLLYPGGPAYHAAPAPAAAGAAPLTFAPTDWRAAARAAGGRQLNSLNVGGMSGASMMAGPMSLTPTHTSAGMARPPAPWAALPTSTATPAATSTGGVVPTSAAPFAAVATTTAPAAAAFPAQPSGTTAGAGAPTVANVPMPMPLHTSSSLPAFGTALSQAPIHTTATVPASAPVAWPGPAIYAAAGVAVPTSTAAAGASAGGIPPTAPKTKKSSGHKRGSSWDGHAVSRKHKSSGHRHRHHHHKPSSTGGLSANTSERSGPPSDYGDYGDDLGTPSSWSNPSSQCPSENGDRDSDFNTSLDPNSVEGIRLDERLRQLITTDPTRARRIIANRRSAARSKVKQANGVSELQERAQALGAEVSDLNSEGTRLSQAGLELTLEQANLRAEVAQWESRISAANAEAHSLRETLKQLGGNPAEVEARAVPAANAASAMAVKLHHERQHAAAMAAASAQAAGAQRQQFPMGAGGTASAAPRRKSPTSGRRKAAPPPIQVPPTAGGMPVPSPVGFMTAHSAPTTPLTATSDVSGMHTVASTSNIAGQMNMHAG